MATVGRWFSQVCRGSSIPTSAGLCPYTVGVYVGLSLAGLVPVLLYSFAVSCLTWGTSHSSHFFGEAAGLRGLGLKMKKGVELRVLVLCLVFGVLIHVCLQGINDHTGLLYFPFSLFWASLLGPFDWETSLVG